MTEVSTRVFLSSPPAPVVVPSAREISLPRARRSVTAAAFREGLAAAVRPGVARADPASEREEEVPQDAQEADEEHQHAVPKNQANTLYVRRPHRNNTVRSVAQCIACR